MITSEGPVGRFVIATPTKCGTTTLEEMARRHRGGRAGTPRDTFRIMDWEKPRRQHRMVPPAGWHRADRYMMVRNPYTRYVSMYEYLKAPANYSKFGAREVQRDAWRGWGFGRKGLHGHPLGFEDFLGWLVEAREVFSAPRWQKRRGYLSDARAYRSPWVWLDGLDESLRLFGGISRVHLLRMEDLWREMARLKAWYRLEDLSVRPSIHANRGLRRSGSYAWYWGGIEHGVGCFDGDEFIKGMWDLPGECLCNACRVGVFEEALNLGYV